jgi:methylthioribose-1-phosphate isomerase
MAVAAEAEGPAEQSLRRAAERIARTRPTAVELSSGANGALQAALSATEDERTGALWAHARDYITRRIAEDLALGEAGAAILPEGAAVLTHCNTGALATGGIGTAMGVVRVAWARGRLSRCYATETRPLLQGARLTAWELARAGIPATLLPDTAAAALIASGNVHAVITGADRIAANGDAANKIGTYGLALAAARHGVPFYIAAPRSTFDLACPSGLAIPIEFRDASEVGGYAGQRWSPDGLDAFNPAFDVTPADLISALITEAGVVRPPFGPAIRALFATETP